MTSKIIDSSKNLTSTSLRDKVYWLRIFPRWHLKLHKIVAKKYLEEIGICQNIVTTKLILQSKRRKTNFYNGSD